MSSPRGCFLCWHRSSYSSCFPSMNSASRNASRKIHQTSGKSYDFVDAPSSPSLNRSSSLRMPSHLNSRNASSRSNNPIMYSNSSGMLKPPPIERKLECTLEDLCFGCKKKIKITRDVLTDTGLVSIQFHHLIFFAPFFFLIFTLYWEFLIIYAYTCM